MDLQVRKMSKNDDAEAIASMIFSTSYFRMPFHFLKERDAINALQKAMDLPGTEYSSKNFWLCFDGNKMIGLLQGYEPTSIDVREASKTYARCIKDVTFIKGYVEWRQTSAPVNDVGTSVIIHDICFADGYDWYDAATVMMLDFLADMNDLDYNCVYVDAVSGDTNGIEFLKSRGFEPDRYIKGDDYATGYVRMKLRISKSVNYRAQESMYQAMR